MFDASIYRTKVCILRFQIIMNRQNLTSVFTKVYVQRCTFLHIYMYLILTETHIKSMLNSIVSKSADSLCGLNS